MNFADPKVLGMLLPKYMGFLIIDRLLWVAGI
jgi:hypothetical protein